MTHRDLAIERRPKGSSKLDLLSPPLSMRAFRSPGGRIALGAKPAIVIISWPAQLVRRLLLAEFLRVDAVLGATGGVCYGGETTGR
jgi:hypothetical protein